MFILIAIFLLIYFGRKNLYCDRLIVTNLLSHIFKRSNLRLFEVSKSSLNILKILLCLCYSPCCSYKILCCSCNTIVRIYHLARSHCSIDSFRKKSAICCNTFIVYNRLDAVRCGLK